MAVPALNEFLKPFISLPPLLRPDVPNSGFLAKEAELSQFPSALEAVVPNHGLSPAERPFMTVREEMMMRFMNAITDEPNWDVKVFDDEIVAEWRSYLEGRDDIDVSEKMMDWIIEELRDKARFFKETGLVLAYDGGVVKSDLAIPESLQLALRAAAARLEDVPEKEKDWHPGSDNQVLDLVHPSLFPLIYGKSRIVTDKTLTIEDGIAMAGKGETIPAVDRPPKDGQYSHHYQWLPCEVAFQTPVDGDGDFRCEITSYINNLHPHDHPELYGIIGQIITRTIPLWNITLPPVVRDNPGWIEQRIPYTQVRYDPDPECTPVEMRPQREEGEGEAEYRDRLLMWEEEIQETNLVQPEPEGHYTPQNPPQNVDLKNKYREQGLQVIVKLANIQLTPENPEYAGGTWHAEGQLNERICATALYYYDSKNITENDIAFAHQSGFNDFDELSYPEGHRAWFYQIFGINHDEAHVQVVGSVKCEEGRLLTFPNIFQSNVDHFRLADPTKPGHQKILELFLVDPNTRIISTAHVPAQRRDWWFRQVPWEKTTARFLPAEIQAMVEEQVEEFPISMEEAKRHREYLMGERRMLVSEYQSDWSYPSVTLREY